LSPAAPSCLPGYRSTRSYSWRRTTSCKTVAYAEVALQGFRYISLSTTTSLICQNRWVWKSNFGFVQDLDFNTCLLKIFAPLVQKRWTDLCFSHPNYPIQQFSSKSNPNPTTDSIEIKILYKFKIISLLVGYMQSNSKTKKSSETNSS